jgi:hypothetical protein
VATFLFLLALFLAIRSLVSLILKRRDGLHELLVTHVKQARAEVKKKRQIIEFRKRKRKKKKQEAPQGDAAAAVAAEPPAKAA